MSFTWQAAREELARRRARALRLGGEEAVARQQAAGRATIRERLALLADAGSFAEIGTLAAHRQFDAQGREQPPTSYSYVGGLAKVGGRPVAIGGEDFTVGGGAPTGDLDREKGWGGFLEDLALEYKMPFLMCIEGVGGGVKIQQEIGHAIMPDFDWSRSFRLLAEVPVLSAIVGPTAGGTAARAVLAHFTVMTRKTACIFAGGPPLVRRALGAVIDKFALGGAEVHTRLSGVIDNVAEDEADAIGQLKTVLSYLPQNVWELPPVLPCEDPVDRRCDELLTVVPQNRRRGYEPRRIIEVVVDRGSFFEIGRDWGCAVVQGLARIGGQSVGVLASNPMHLGGAVDGPAAEKQTRFIELCDTFNLPVVYFVDVPGFMIGEEAEKAGVLRRGMRAIQAVQETEVPFVTIHVRKAYGMGVQVTNNPRRLGLRLAWPSAEWGDIPIEGGVEAAFRREIEAAADPEAYRRQAEAQLLADASPWKTAEAFGVPEIIDPAETRFYICRFLEASLGARKLRLGPRPRWGPRVG